MKTPQPSNAGVIDAAMSAAYSGDFTQVATAVRIWTGQRRVLDGTDLFDLERTVSDLAAAVAAAGYTNDTIHAWIAAGDRATDRHTRRAAGHITTMILDDHLVPGQPWARLQLDPLTDGRRRPLLPFEAAACRVVVELAGINRPRWGTIFGLREAGACATEVSAVTQGDMTLSRRKVALAGNGRANPRTGALTSWAVPHIADHTAGLPADAVGDEHSLVYRGKHELGSPKAAAAPGMTMLEILTAAWIDAPDVGPDSVRNTHALIRFGGGNPLPVQEFLGTRSVDQALREIGQLPHQPPRRRPGKAA